MTSLSTRSLAGLLLLLLLLLPSKGVYSSAATDGVRETKASLHEREREGGRDRDGNLGLKAVPFRGKERGREDCSLEVHLSVTCRASAVLSRSLLPSPSLAIRDSRFAIRATDYHRSLLLHFADRKRVLVSLFPPTSLCQRDSGGCPGRRRQSSSSCLFLSLSRCC